MKFPDSRQKGVVLLLLLLIFLVTGTTFMLSSFNNRQDIYLQQQAELSLQMQLAKEALLAFAANSSAIHGNTRGPGFFPCPDTGNTGSADASCDAGAVNLGRLPEYVDAPGGKVALNSYYASINRQFWYAIAPYYTYSATDEDDRNADRRTLIDSMSLLALDNTNNIVALIIAPGEALGFQDRNAGQLAASNFLEGGNADGDSGFVTADVDNPGEFNDGVLAITRDELIPYIAGSAALEIKRVLDEHYDSQTVEPKHYPGDPNDSAQTPDAYHAEFAEVMKNNSWLTDESGPSNEQWAANTFYTLVSATEASVQFKGCAGLSFTLAHDGGLVRNGSAC